jgi:hypothetical protein
MKNKIRDEFSILFCLIGIALLFHSEIGLLIQVIWEFLV